MTINDIMLRDLHDAEREEREREAAAYEREISRRLWRRRVLHALDVAGAVLAVATLALLAWCCMSDAAHVFNISR